MAQLENTTQPLINLMPTWEVGVRALLEAGRYDDAGAELSAILEDELSTEEWGAVYWEGILKGLPVIRGNIDEATWKEKVLPIMGRAIFAAASPDRLVNFYSTLDPVDLPLFHGLIVAAIPGEDAQQKLNWLKENSTSLYVFFTANPAGFFVSNQNQGILNQENNKRFSTLPWELRNVLAALKTAEAVQRIAERNHLPQERLSALSLSLGKVILGFVHVEDLAIEIEKEVKVPRELASTLSGELVTRILGPLRPAIEKSYFVLGAEESQPSLKRSETHIESETTGLYPKPYEPISPPPSKFFVSKSEGEKKTDLNTEAKKPEKFSPLTYGNKFNTPQSQTIFDESKKDSTSDVPKVAPKMIHEEKSVLPISNIPRLGLGLDKDKLGSVGDYQENEAGPMAKLEMSGISAEQLERIKKEPLPSFMKREIPPPRVVNYDTKNTPNALRSENKTIPKRNIEAPNFPINVTPSPGKNFGRAVKALENARPPLPGIPLGVDKKTETFQKKEDSPDVSSIKINNVAPKKKSWLGGLWGETNSGSDIYVKKDENEGKKEGSATPIQVFQAKKVDYKEAPKKESAEPMLKSVVASVPTAPPKKMEISMPKPEGLEEKEVIAPAITEAKKDQPDVKNENFKAVEVKPAQINKEEVGVPKKSFWGSLKKGLGFSGNSKKKEEVFAEKPTTKAGSEESSQPKQDQGKISDVQAVPRSVAVKPEIQTQGVPKPTQMADIPKPPQPPTKNDTNPKA